jgi:hypothetical protein
MAEFNDLRVTVDRDLTAREAAQAATFGAMRQQGQRPLNLIATGDSWFDYPLTGQVPIPSDVIAQLRRHAQPTPLILNLAHHGDAVTGILGTSKRARLAAALADQATYGKFDAILFSGGGNDIAGDEFRFWLNDAAGNLDPAHAINDAMLEDILGIVTAGYNDLADLRDAVVPGTPILVHAYAFAQPNNLGVCGLGPWLFPSFQQRGWMTDPANAADLARGSDIIRVILLRFHDRLRSFAVSRPNVILVETQDLVAPNQWANELHPTPAGFRAAANAFAAALLGQFPNWPGMPAAPPPNQEQEGGLLS